ncbi:hypothetical protein K432DRAFT_195827 [Lepidopterella palustris CBS 459.81]|uniref:MARVEL domain-containing protein n=1 Tax=Lepidopterella palustris CBS 459.81 TaxID=1314670 RepID=A0A8E2EFS5_9PEZI|nr:hypothetical protein K432DRAFT_195827 [Lepidopterella palustris CBS 459.81]
MFSAVVLVVINYATYYNWYWYNYGLILGLYTILVILWMASFPLLAIITNDTRMACDMDNPCGAFNSLIGATTAGAVEFLLSAINTAAFSVHVYRHRRNNGRSFPRIILGPQPQTTTINSDTLLHGGSNRLSAILDCHRCTT